MFTDIVNRLKAFGKDIEEEIVKNFLRLLLERWKTKVTVLSDTKDLTKFSYDDLIGSLP